MVLISLDHPTYPMKQEARVLFIVVISLKHMRMGLREVLCGLVFHSQLTTEY